MKTISFEEMHTFVMSRELPAERYMEAAILDRSNMFLVKEADVAIKRIDKASVALNRLKKQLLYKPGNAKAILAAGVGKGEVRQLRSIHGHMLVLAELGELAKALATGDTTNIAEEIGDILFGLDVLADAHGLSLGQCAAVMKAKLEKRPPVLEADKRNVELERSTMEVVLSGKQSI